MADSGTIACGDCRQPVERKADHCGERGIDSSDEYCPRCAAGRSAVIDCPHCGSRLCRNCGAIAESVEDLGIG